MFTCVAITADRANPIGHHHHGLVAQAEGLLDAAAFHDLVGVHALTHIPEESLTLIVKKLEDSFELIPVRECFYCLGNAWFG
jgi:hypothetical protein